MRRLTALLLALLLCMPSAWGAGVEISLNAEKSDVLSEGALRALNAVLADVKLIFVQEDDAACVALMEGENPLLQVHSDGEASFLSANGFTAQQPTGVKWDRMPSLLTDAIQRLCELTSAWEKWGASSADLKSAGKPKTQATYAVAGEDWAALWPDVCGILLPALQTCLPKDTYAQAETYLRGMTIRGKGTLRRYFAADGTEMGAYFYAAQAGDPTDLREIRLEYGQTPDKGFYLAFRCPNPKGTRNARITVQGKTTVSQARTTYTLSADIRITHDGDADTCLMESTLRQENGQLTGKAELNMTHKRAGVTKKYGLIIKPQLLLTEEEYVGTAAVTAAINGKTWLDGKATISAYAGEMPSLPQAAGEMQKIYETLPYTVFQLLRRGENEDMQQLLHYLSKENYLNGETTTQVYVSRPDGP